jgi:hypothetical protein
MPVVEPTKANFDKGYQFNISAKWYAENGLDAEGLLGEPSLWLNYTRYIKRPHSIPIAQRIVDDLGIVNGDSIGIIGAGFGWTVEQLALLLPSSEIVGVDTSPWIQGEKGTTEEAEIIAACNAVGITDPARQQVWVSRVDGDVIRTPANVVLYDYDLTRPGDRNKFLNEIAGASYTWGITEDVLPWLTDNEMQVLSTEMHKICDNVAHYVTEFSQEQADQGQEPEPVYNWHTLPEYKALIPADVFMAALTKETL